VTTPSAALKLRLPNDWLEFARLYAARLIGLVLGTALTIVSARVLAPVGRGEFATVSAAVVLVAQALNLGMSSSLAVLFSRRRARIGDYRAHLVYVSLGWAAMLTAFGATQAWLHLPIGFGWWPALAAWVPLQLLGLYQAAALVALQDAKYLSLIELAGRGSALVLGGSALLVLGSDVRGFVAAVIASDGVVAALGAVRLARLPQARPVRPRRAARFFGAAVRLGLRAYPALVLGFLVIKSDILMLRLFRGPAETGIYSIASQLVDIALILPGIVGSLSLASVIRSSRPATELLRVMRPAAWSIFLLAAAMLALGHWAIVLVFGRPFEEAYRALALLVPGFICLALTGLLGQYFAARGFPLFLSLYWLLGFVTNLALNLALVPRFGLLAAASSSSVAYGLVFVLLWLRFRSEHARESTLPSEGTRS
jgi:O-antigen/teichoic acid export membrane protein